MLSPELARRLQWIERICIFALGALVALGWCERISYWWLTLPVGVYVVADVTAYCISRARMDRRLGVRS